MALVIDNEEAYGLARELADETGESLTDAVKTALRERLEVVRSGHGSEAQMAEIARIQVFVAALPDIDTRSTDEILSYDDFGLPS